MVSPDLDAAVRFVVSSLSAAADPVKAAAMQAYMKTEMPFYGVQKAGRTPILRQLTRDFPPRTDEDYEAQVLAFWNLPHREEKYIALGVARRFKIFVTPNRLPLYHDLIVEGAWWDLVDEVATNLVRPLVVGHAQASWPSVDNWIHHPDLWLRRSAIICQIGAKDRTDAERLFEFCRQGFDEKDFFVRKAIGWALRDYAKTDPDAVADFVNKHGAQMSGLSFREASKHIKHLVEP